MSLFQWEHQLFCYDWLFYKCFSVPFFRNVLTRSGYWLLITQLNCLYCTTDFLALTWPDSFDTREVFVLFFFSSGNKRWNNVNCFKTHCWDINSSYWLIQLQSLNTLFVITVNITSYESLIVYYCKYIWSLCKSSPYKIEINVLSCLFLSNRLYLGSPTASSLLLLSVSEAPVKSEINKC